MTKTSQQGQEDIYSIKGVFQSEDDDCRTITIAGLEL